MISASPRNCSGVRSPRTTLICTVEKPAWRWGWTLTAAQRSYSLPSPFGLAYVAGAGGAPASSSSTNRSGVGSKSRSATQSPFELLVDLPRQLLDAVLVDEHLDARPRAVGPQPVLAVVDAQHRLGDLEVLAVVGGHELAQGRRDARHDRGAAAHAHLEALHAVADARDEGHVVDAGDRAVLVGGREGRLHLARHQLRGGVADEVAHVRAHVGSGVEQLALAHAGPRVAGHVADGVAAALAARQAGVGQLADRLGRLAQRDVVELDVLAGGDVALVERRVLLHHVGELLHLLRRDPAERELRPDHLDVRLALAVDPLLQPEADELVLRRLTVEVLLGLVVEVVELALEDGDDVARDVLVDLRVVQGPLLALALGAPCRRRGNRFHRRKVPKASRDSCLLSAGPG